ncbi:MAG: FHA domain-containing protein, partial [Anaerolineaceae bacterium]|nr:FHA domain-containing protein [Anaerolineaceae bacterium]
MNITLKYQVNPGAPWTEVRVTKDWVIGRSDECDLVIGQEKVSRQHARVVDDGQNILLIDLNSANGTFHEGKKLRPNEKIVLRNGSTFRIGTTVFEIVLEDNKELPFLIWYRIGSGNWQKQLFSEILTIGRDENCDLTLDEGHVSREHCQIFVRDGKFYIRDSGSHNGTYLEKHRLQAGSVREFLPGQYFSIGRVSMTLSEVKKQEQYQTEIKQYHTAERVAVIDVQKQQRQKKRVPVWSILIGVSALIMICVCVTVFGVLFILEDNQPVPSVVAIVEADITQTGPTEIETPVPTETTVIPTGTPAPAEPEVVVVEDTKVEWLVLLYQDADDESLEEDIVFDVNSAEYIGSSDKVKILAQLDRYSGAYSGDGDWSQARRYMLETDSNLDILGTNYVEDLGEVDSGDVQTLIDFVLWGLNEYPAEHVILILSDHGGGWFGGYTDGDNENDDGIFLPALESALGYITSNSSIDKIDIVGFDACLMAQLEVYSILAPYADFVIASEETESATGWAYASFLNELIQSADMTPAALSQVIVDTFVVDDLYYQYYGQDPEYVMDYSTLSAMDLSGIFAINEAFNQFILNLQWIDP